MPPPNLIVQRVMAAGHRHPGPRPGDPAARRRRRTAARLSRPLPLLIDSLRAKGYRLVTVDQLAGMTPVEAMPETSRSSIELWIDSLGFGFFRYVDFLLTASSSPPSCWGWRGWSSSPAWRSTTGSPRRAARRRCSDPETRAHGLGADPGASTRRRSSSPRWRASSTRTGRIWRCWCWTTARPTPPRPRCARRSRTSPRAAAGPSRTAARPRRSTGAWPRAWARSWWRLDADTLFPSETVPSLVRWFADPRVGAVAGNAVVGNRLNLVHPLAGRWNTSPPRIWERRALARSAR